MTRSAWGFATCAVVMAWCVAAEAQHGSPTLVVRLVAEAGPEGTGSVRLVATASREAGSPTTRSLGTVVAECVEEVGGAESLAVMRCSLATGAVLELEIVQRGNVAWVDAYQTAREGAERTRTRRVRLAAARPGEVLVARCVATRDDPRACPPTGTAVGGGAPVACRVEHTRTEYDVSTRAPSTVRSLPRRLVPVWGDMFRETDWSDVAPAPLTFTRARRLPGAAEDRIRGTPIVIVQATGGGSLTYAFDASGRTARVSWDPQADSRSFEYVYRYACPASSTRSERPVVEPAR